ncbi:MAG: hypothetical protein AAF707_03340 [Pseudomonadota bacterium]
MTLLLAACASESGTPLGTDIECAVGAGAKLSSGCILEGLDGGNSFVIHHPDGGFRRFERDPEGQFRPADGGEPFEARQSLDVTPEIVFYRVGQDRYRVERSAISQLGND